MPASQSSRGLILCLGRYPDSGGGKSTVGWLVGEFLMAKGIDFPAVGVLCVGWIGLLGCPLCLPTSIEVL